MLKKILQVCGNLFFAFLKGKFYFFHMHISETSATTSTNIIVDFFFFKAGCEDKQLVIVAIFIFASAVHVCGKRSLWC